VELVLREESPGTSAPSPSRPRCWTPRGGRGGHDRSDFPRGDGVRRGKRRLLHPGGGGAPPDLLDALPGEVQRSRGSTSSCPSFTRRSASRRCSWGPAASTTLLGGGAGARRHARLADSVVAREYRSPQGGPSRARHGGGAESIAAPSSSTSFRRSRPFSSVRISRRSAYRARSRRGLLRFLTRAPSRGGGGGRLGEGRVAASLLMARCRRAADRTSRAWISRRIISKLNDMMCETTTEDKFRRCSTGASTWKRRLPLHERGAHLPCLSAGKNKVTVLDYSGLILGVNPGFIYEEKVVAFDPGDVLADHDRRGDRGDETREGNLFGRSVSTICCAPLRQTARRSGGR